MKQRNKLGQFIQTIPELNKTCLVCGIRFSSKSKKAKYCGRECYYKMKRARKDRVLWTEDMRNKLSEKYKGKGNPAYGKPSWNKGKKVPQLWGERHGNWKGGWMERGYWFISVEGRQVGEHTWLMEQQIGRRLTADEVVHHINHDKLDNRIENLMLLSRSEHPKIHSPFRKSIQKGLQEEVNLYE